MFTKLSAAQIVQAGSGFRDSIELFGPTLTVGTAFAGSDVGVKSLEVLSSVTEEHLGVSVRFEHLWSCEKDPGKQAFLTSQVRPPLLFSDTTGLRHLRQNSFAHPYIEPPPPLSSAMSARVGDEDRVGEGTGAMGEGTISHVW